MERKHDDHSKEKGPTILIREPEEILVFCRNPRYGTAVLAAAHF